jgi:acyl carrier protein
MDIKHDLLTLIAYQTAVDQDVILLCNTWKDIGIDSLDTLEIMLSVSERFKVTIEEEDEENLLNFDQLLSYIELKLQTE